MSVFVHAQGIKTVPAGGRGEGRFKKWQNSAHVVVECPLIQIDNRLYKVYKAFEYTFDVRIFAWLFF